MLQSKIMIVEDDEAIRDGLRECLEVIGHSVVSEASSGEEAISEAQKVNPDLVLMDICLEGDLDGIDAATKIHKDQNIPILFLTARSDAATLERAKKTGQCQYLVKPISSKELQIAIEMALHNQEMTGTLRENEEKFQSVLESTTDGVVITDPSRVILSWNAAAKNIFGYDELEILGRPLSSLFLERLSHEGLSETPALDFDSAHDFVGQRVEMYGKKKGGNIFPVELTTTRGQVGKERFFCCIIHDISGKKESEEKQQLLQKAIDNTQMGVTITDPHGTILFTNSAEAKMHGYLPEELIGKSVRTFAPRDTWHPISLAERQLNRGTGWRRESINVDRTGRQFAVDLVSDIVKDEKGVPIGIVSCSQDASERKKIEEERRLIEVAKVKSQIISSISHELRTPLNAVIGMTGLLAETHLDTEQKEYASTIKLASETLLTLINDVLDFSKLEAGKMELEQAPFNLQLLAKEVMELLSFQAGKKELSVELIIHEDVPRVLIGDAGRLRQVLLNLVGNAIKFTDSGKIVMAFSVHLSGPTAPPMVKCEVTDEGRGIPSDLLPTMFEVFSRSTSAEVSDQPGTGLGLSICKRLVNLMKGDISVESTAGEGSCFTFTFPMILGPVSEEMNSLISPVSRRKAPLQRAARILVVDDYSMNQRVVERMIEKMGHRVDTVGNGREALQSLYAIPYDLVLMDCKMPVMDGYQATQILRRTKKDLPVIAMTALTTQEDKELCRKSGMSDYISKPIDRAKLEHLVEKWLAGSHHSSEAVVETRALEELKELNIQGKPDLVREVISLFLKTAPDRLIRLQTSLDQKDLDGVSSEAHALVSATGQVGATNMRHICREIENAARKGEITILPNEMKALELEFVRVRKFLETYLEGQ